MPTLVCGVVLSLVVASALVTPHHKNLAHVLVSSPLHLCHKQGRALQPRMVTISAAKGQKELDEVADFFVSSFWAQSTACEKVELTAAGRNRLLAAEKIHMCESYGELVGTRRLKSTLLLARDVGGDIIGCVGLEVAVVNWVDQCVLSRAQSESLFTAAMSALSARERNQYRKLALKDLADELLEPGYCVCPLLSNLAVSSRCRGTGIGRELCIKCETLARDWQYGGIVLQVEENNIPAVGLYSSLGYTEIFRNEGSSALRLQLNGDLKDALVTMLVMSKGVQ